MARPTSIHVEQPILIDCGNPTELIFQVADPPEAGIATWVTEFKLRTASAPDGEEVASIPGEMNKGEDGVDEVGSIRVVVDSDTTKDLTAGGFYRWDHWRLVSGQDPKLLAVGPCTIRRTVRFPEDP